MGRIEPREFVLEDGRKGIIRNCEETDREKVWKQISSVLKEAKYTVRTGSDDEAVLTQEKGKEKIRKFIDDKGKLFVVAEINGQIVGSADLYNGEHKRIQHVSTVGITVLKNFRRLGVGKELMETVIKWASDHLIIEKIALGVFSNNAAAIGLYKKLGFVEEGRKTKEIKIGPDDYLDSILMYKFVK